ncbi:biotin carboxylase [Paraburkholderia caledonica]|uniref:biotin carboxylase n=1 Tax=Paraburkholderia caledonica TaxID=134536 RepID=A0AB73ILX8_9BURK|nr:biotin carboxylase [Paraburkholderia caledonica]
MYPGYTIPPNYDSLIGKLLTHGATREQAIARMRVALDEISVAGIDTTIPLHRELMGEPGFRGGGFDIHHLERLIESGAFAKESQR